ncbi:unnamed protein product [Rhizoctonia solani]|uniref:Uncharacterized protein n=1 Tax=Rhizoctonia solani TaxID=456999 RepID=A0A8H3GJA3_9AGAM|nr:unnamed protein product [Rhizoctonia solani]
MALAFPPMNEHPDSQENDAGFLECLYKDPDSNSSEQRYRGIHQWRPISWNPFDIHNQSESIEAEDEYEKLLGDPLASPQEELLKPVVLSASPKAESNRLQNPGPTWVNLFYDLAWTATFSNLTQNGEFDTTWDTVSYTAFFVVVWWLWASQVLYSINFYTDDWFHLLSIFLQMSVFGLLAATTRGYDVTTYILHSPGLDPDVLETKSLNDITDPKRYNDEKTARASIQVIAFSIAMSRVILLVQHLRVLAYAHITVQSNRGRGYHIPRKLHIIPIGLTISTALFFTAWGITNSEFGTTVLGAKLKYVFWSSGLIVEVFSHVRMSRISWRPPRVNYRINWFWKIKTKNYEPEIPHNTSTTESRSIRLPFQPPELPVPQSDVTMSSRLQAITTIILGEGINCIAGTLYSIIAAPGLENPIVVNIFCSGFIVYFLAYLYFEGPSSGHMDPKDKSRRKVYWLLLHLPFLLCIVLLLQGVKNQFLLTSFLSTSRKVARELEDVDEEVLRIWTPDLGSNVKLTHRLLEYNISWSEEHTKLVELMRKHSPQGNALAPLNEKQKEELYIWHWRLSLRTLLRIHDIFMGNNKVSDKFQDLIRDYYNNKAAPRKDHDMPSDAFADLIYYQILEKVLEHSIRSARYIMVLAGSIFILLGALDLAHSKPRDRFQCGAIISRFLMGWVFMFLLLLNVGEHQSLWVNKGHESEQAGIFLWISSYWVLPTIALAFGIQFLVETTLVWLAALVRERYREKSNAPLARMAWRSLRRAVLLFNGAQNLGAKY